MKVIPVALINDPHGQLGALSNFYMRTVLVEGSSYQSVEHYFQAQKFSAPAIISRVRNAVSAASAKEAAWTADSHVRPDWLTVREKVMLTALRFKVEQDKEVSSLLERTWPVPILEDSISDDHWGIGASGTGANKMGRLLMAVRDDLIEATVRAKITPSSQPLLVERPEHGSASRYSFACVTPPWCLPSAGSGDLFGAIEPSPLTEMSVPNLAERWITRHGLHMPLVASASKRLSRFQLCAGLLKANSALAEDRARSFVTAALDAAFDEKYADYLWCDDARALFPGWVNNFLQIVESNFGPVNEWTPGIVIGAGPGEEAAHIWRHFGHHLTLVDIGDRLVGNCRNQSPSSVILKAHAENLSKIADQSVGFYCALRTYQSAYFDIRKSVAEARRVLRPGGAIILSIANGYVGRAGRFVSGQIAGSAFVDLSMAAACVADTATELASNGFEEAQLRDLGTEWLLMARKPDLAN
jgi:ribA/ribD-fused uncharacterized protein